jgi:hypothetical protein
MIIRSAGEHIGEASHDYARDRLCGALARIVALGEVAEH